MAAVMQRDARTTNRMEGAAKLIHVRLECWGRWCKENASPGAYPAAGPIANMMEYGLVGAASSHAPTEMPQAIAETDHAVQCLPPQEKAAIRRYYLYWEPTEVAARNLRLNVREFQRLLQRARWRIDIALNLYAR